MSIINFYDILNIKKTKGEKGMDLFNIICGVCSVIGLLVSIFTASKVMKISQNIKNKLKDVDISGSYAGRDNTNGI